jgi:hypothetical protein
MKRTILIAVVAGLVAGFVTIPMARHMAEIAASLPAISEVSLCYAFDTPHERSAFVRHIATASGVIVSLTVIGALKLKEVIIRKKKRRSSEAARGYTALRTGP